MRSLFVVFVLFFSVLVTTTFAQEIPAPVKAKLVSNIDSIKPGGSFKLGVFFEIDPGWHIYWKYPGETGLPTKVEFKLPTGYKVGELIWPVPSIYAKPDGGADYGYAASVLLWADVQVPSTLKPDQSSEIEVQISWVSCKEICIPGKENLIYDAKISKETKWNGEDLFSEWHNSLPLDLSNRENPFEFEITTTKTDNDIINVALSVNYKEKVGEINFYPNPGNSLIVQNLNSVKLKNSETTKISFDVTSSDEIAFTDEVLEGLIVYTDSAGNRSAVEMKIELNDT